MNPELSEFSYGFALTNEIVGWLSVTAAPVFPSLIEEGKKGGGYDVKLDAPGLPLFLQFKRSHYMTKKSAKEKKKYALPLTMPFYRFHLRDGRSIQHDLLLELDDGTNLVYYAAPCFSKLDEINSAYLNGRVTSDSIFVRPQDIGALTNEPHHVAFDGAIAYLCSEPKPLEWHRAESVQLRMQAMLEKEKRPLETVIREKISQMRDSRERVRSRLKAADAAYFDSLVAPRLRIPDSGRAQIRQPLPPPEEGRALLREAADEALALNTQLFVIQ